MMQNKLGDKNEDDKKFEKEISFSFSGIPVSCLITKYLSPRVQVSVRRWEMGYIVASGAGEAELVNREHQGGLWPSVFPGHNYSDRIGTPGRPQG